MIYTEICGCWGLSINLRNADIIPTKINCKFNFSGTNQNQHPRSSIAQGNSVQGQLSSSRLLSWLLTGSQYSVFSLSADTGLSGPAESSD